MRFNQPVVGARGLWKLQSPYDNLLPINTALTCTAVSNYGQLESMGIDTYTVYYSAKSIDKDTYKNHIDDEARIVFVKDDSGRVYSFPLHYLIEYPIGTGVGYQSTAIFIRLGALPVDESIEPLIAEVQELVTSKLGIKSHAEAAAISNVRFVSNEEHTRVKTARQNLKKENKPTLLVLQEALEETKALKLRLNIAERQVIDQYNLLLNKDREISQLEKENKKLKANQRT